MWRKLLVPHDFSTCAAHATQLAVDLAKTHRAGIAFLHVSSLPAKVTPDTLITPPGATSPVSVGEYVVRGAERELERIAAPLRDAGLAVESRAVTGDVEAEILAAVDAMAVDVIVMGTHGREGLSHAMLGSVAEKVIRRARVPVLTVRWSRGHSEPTKEELQVEDQLAD